MSVPKIEQYFYTALFTTINNMLLPVGTRIDLRTGTMTFPDGSLSVQKKTIPEPDQEPFVVAFEDQEQNLVPVGTRFIWNKATGKFSRAIPVAFA